MVVVVVAVVVVVVAVEEEEAVVADAAGRGSVWTAIVHILGRLCTLDAKETLVDGTVCAAFTRLLASMYEMPSVALTVQTSFSNFQAGQSREKVE